MSTLFGAREGASAVDNGVDLVKLARTIWSEMPLLMAANLLLTFGISISLLIGLSIPPLGPILAAVLIGPVWLGTVAACDGILGNQGPGWRDLLKGIRHHARTAIGISLVPAAVGTILILSLDLVGRHHDQRWLWFPIGADAVVLTVLMLGAFTIFPLAVSSTSSGRERWIEALGFAGKHLTATLGMASLLVLLALSIRYTGPFFALVMSAPIAMLSTAVVRGYVGRIEESN
jgi:uncharacterized membrane protein YesL